MGETKNFTIVMYHYVRDLKNSRYPEIKGLDVTLFKEQLAYFKKHYSIIKMEDVIEAAHNGEEIPENALLLTFDDGYKDHFDYVFPILDDNKIQGSFFPPAKAILENKVLDVNKIHYILATEEDKNKIIKDIFDQIDSYRHDYNLASNEELFNKLAIANRFDPKEVIFIKRILQTELMEELRNNISDHLFMKYVGMNEQSISRELYMSLDQIKCLVRHGMHVGSHGYEHYWLNHLTEEKLEEQIQLSIEFLNRVGADTTNWTMCYPYGGYNEATTQILEKKKCKLALTTVVDIADLKKYSKYSLPRLDTNDFPKDGNAEPNSWTKKLHTIGGM